MFNVKSVATLSILVSCTACTGEFAPEENPKQLQDYSIQDDGIAVWDVEGAKVLLSSEEYSADMSMISSQFDFEVEKIAVVAGLEDSTWMKADDVSVDLPYSAEEMVNELSTSGEGELSLMVLDIEDDLVVSVETAINSGAQLVFVVIDDSTVDAVEIISAAYN